MSLLASSIQRMREFEPPKFVRDAIGRLQPVLRLRLRHSFKDHRIGLLARDCSLADLRTLGRHGKNKKAICTHIEYHMRYRVDRMG